jgi:lipoteichoic acid synthase
MKKMLRLGYFLSIAYHDFMFRLFFVILILKLVLFTYITKLGDTSFFPSFGIILIVSGLSLLIKNKLTKFSYLLLLDILLSFTFFSNTLYFFFFRRFASLYFINQIHQLPAVFDAVLGIIGIRIFFMADFLFMPLSYFYVNQDHNYHVKDIKKAVTALIVVGLYFNIMTGYCVIKFANKTSISAYSRPGLVSLIGIINYQIYDFYNYALTDIYNEEAAPSEINHVLNWFGNSKVSAKHNDLTGIGKGLNLIVIQVESLQNFVINKRYKGNEITPNLNRLINKGIYFSNFYDQSDAGRSSDAAFLANCSLYPSRKGAVSFFYPQNHFDSLPNVLNKNCYSTTLLHNYDGNLWNMETFGKTLGFKDQYYEDSFLRNDILNGRISDRSFFLQSAARIKNLPFPFYAYLMTFSSHEPFTNVTKEIDKFPLGELEGDRIGHYIRSIHYVDSALGEFMHNLSGHNLLSKTVVVLYGDHAARLTDKELLSVGITDMSEINKIPLIIICPTSIKMDKRDTIGGLIDLSPTVCNILGIDISDKFFIGKDLGQRKKSFVVFRDGSFISNNGSIVKTTAQEQLMVSDLIIEKDMIALTRRKPATSYANY